MLSPTINFFRINKRRYKLIPVQTLLRMEHKELGWIIPDHLCHGLAIIGGPPKVGKSNLSLSVMVDVALGRNALGILPTQKTSGLYVTLELPLERFHSNVERVLGNREVKVDENLNLYFEDYYDFPNVGTELEERIEQYIISDPSLKFIIIDTLGKLVESGEYFGSTSYLKDYQLLSNMQEIANEESICIMFVHHTRKAKANYVIDELLGSRGVTAKADTLIVMNQIENNKASLDFVGRNIPNSKYIIDCDPNTLEWQISDEQNIYLDLTPERQDILKVFREYPEVELSSSFIAQKLDKKQPTVSALLSKLLKLEIVNRGTKYGYYKLREDLYDNDGTSDNNLNGKNDDQDDKKDDYPYGKYDNEDTNEIEDDEGDEEW